MSMYLLYRDGWITNAFHYSYLWCVLGIFELIFTNITYIFLVTLTNINKRLQIQFYDKIQDIDNSLFKEFKVRAKYRKFMLCNIVNISVILLYYIISASAFLYWLYSNNLGNIGMILFLASYQMEQVTSGLKTMMYILSVRLITNRFHTLAFIQNTLINNKSSHAKIAVLFNNFKDLCKAIEYLNEECGTIIILRLTHDFTLTTSQLYFIFCVLVDHTIKDKISLVAGVAAWMMQNLIKLGFSAWSTEMAVQEVLHFDSYV